MNVLRQKYSYPYENNYSFNFSLLKSFLKNNTLKNEIYSQNEYFYTVDIGI